MAGIAAGAGAERPLRVMLLAGVAAPIVAWGLSVPAIVTWPGYDPIAQSISLLANAPNGWLQTAAFLVSGGLGFAWAAGMGRVLGAGAGDRHRVWRLLAFQSLLTILFAVFPTDPNERGVSAAGVLHLVNFATYSISMPVTLLLIARVMARDVPWAGWARPTRLAGGVLLLSFALVPLTLYGPLRPWLGLLERIYVAIPTGWEVAVSIAALRRISRASAPR